MPSSAPVGAAEPAPAPVLLASRLVRLLLVLLLVRTAISLAESAEFFRRSRGLA